MSARNGSHAIRWSLERIKKNPQRSQFMTAKDITLDLVIRYGFQVLGAIIILTVGVLLARWVGNFTNRWLEPRVKEPPMRLLMVRAIRILVLILALLVALDSLGFKLRHSLPRLGSLAWAWDSLFKAFLGTLLLDSRSFLPSLTGLENISNCSTFTGGWLRSSFSRRRSYSSISLVWLFPIAESSERFSITTARSVSLSSRSEYLTAQTWTRCWVLSKKSLRQTRAS